MEHDNFIVDGNYGGTMPIRLEFADTIIWLRITRVKAIYRVIKRSLGVRFFNRQRADMAENFTEKFDREYWEFLKFVWNYQKNHVPQIESYLEKRRPDAKVYIVRNQKEKDALLAALTQ